MIGCNINYQRMLLEQKSEDNNGALIRRSMRACANWFAIGTQANLPN